MGKVIKNNVGDVISKVPQGLEFIVKRAHAYRE
jgi:hypothetical protein